MKPIFHLVELLASSPLWIGLCGFGIIIIPILGIQLVHKNK